MSSFHMDTSAQPKITISKAAELLDVSIQAIHKQLKNKDLAYQKIGNKSFLTHSISRELFDIEFDRKTIVSHIVKGGVGKTSAIHNIACCANAYGAKVLQIDIDPQGNLTDANNIDPEESPVLIDVIKEDATIEESVINISEGLDLIPSRIENVICDNTITNARVPLHTLFSDLLKSIEDDYDFIFIDCPPTMGQFVTAANLYADLILAPLNPDKFSAKGLDILKSELKFLESRYRKKIDFKVFLNKFSGNTILSDKAVAAMFSDPEMDGKTLNTAIRIAQEIPNVTDDNKNLFSSVKKSVAREDFDQLTRELLNIELKTIRNKKPEVTKKAVETA